MWRHFKQAKALRAPEEAAVSPAEEALRRWGVGYRRQPDGTLVVPGQLDISGKGLDVLPDLSQVSVEGYFSCSRNRLTSLKGAPRSVGGHFFCYDNVLTTLEGASRSVGGCFICTGNRLTSLAHAPAAVGSEVWCENNPLASLEGAPRAFTKLKSDLGVFLSWEELPEREAKKPVPRRGFNL